MPALNLATLDQVLGTVKFKHVLNTKVKQASVFSISAINILVYYLWVRLGAYPKTRAAMEQWVLKNVNNNLNITFTLTWRHLVVKVQIYT